jgi:hypothetical protein
LMVLLQKRWQQQCRHLLLWWWGHCWSFWSNSLKFTIDNEIVVFFNVECCNG